MSMYGIVIEGFYDEVAITEMVRRLSPMGTEIVSRVCGGKKRLMQKFPDYLESFRYQNQGSHVDKAIVIRDADCKDPEGLKGEMESKIEGRNYPFEVRLNIVVQELEAWFLADEEAISRITGREAHCPNQRPESILNPKDTLVRILSEARVPYTAAVAQNIAKEADLEKIGSRCPRFKEFREAIIDC
jgi:hypothetical protein